MKKLALTIAMVLGLSIGVFAQGGLFQYGTVSDEEYYGTAFYGGNDHGSKSGLFSLNMPEEDATGDVNASPIGGGALLLIGFGAAYALKKRSNK